jgi:hypothetical protein
MTTQYGPLRFSLMRGLLLSIVLPLTAVVIVGLISAVASHEEPQDGVSRIFSLVAGLYRTYPAAALAMHGLIALRASSYRQRYTRSESGIFTLLAVAVLGFYIYRHVDSISGLDLPSFSPAISEQSDQRVQEGPARPQPGTIPLTAPGRPNELQGYLSRRAFDITLHAEKSGLFFLPAQIAGRDVNLRMDPRLPYVVLPAAWYEAVAPTSCQPNTIVIAGKKVDGCVAIADRITIADFDSNGVPIFFSSDPAADAIAGASLLSRFNTVRQAGSIVLSAKR